MKLGNGICSSCYSDNVKTKDDKVVCLDCDYESYKETYEELESWKYALHGLIKN